MHFRAGGLTPAGYRAKSISILVRKSELAELREQIKYELRRGNITAEKAASLSGLIDEINLEGNVAKLRAARPAQVVEKAPETGPFGEDLIQAEAELDAINKKIRTADAVDVSVSAGWNDLDSVMALMSKGIHLAARSAFPSSLGPWPRRDLSMSGGPGTPNSRPCRSR